MRPRPPPLGPPAPGTGAHRSVAVSAALSVHCPEGQSPGRRARCPVGPGVRKGFGGTSSAWPLGRRGVPDREGHQALTVAWRSWQTQQRARAAVWWVQGRAIRQREPREPSGGHAWHLQLPHRLEGQEDGASTAAVPPPPGGWGCAGRKADRWAWSAPPPPAGGHASWTTGRPRCLHLREQGRRGASPPPPPPPPPPPLSELLCAGRRRAGGGQSQGPAREEATQRPGPARGRDLHRQRPAGRTADACARPPRTRLCAHARLRRTVRAERVSLRRGLCCSAQSWPPSFPSMCAFCR